MYQRSNPDKTVNIKSDQYKEKHTLKGYNQYLE